MWIEPHLSSVLSLMPGSNLKLIIPPGRLAIDVFFAPSKTLEEIIGAQLGYAKRARYPPTPPQRDFSLAQETRT